MAVTMQIPYVLALEPPVERNPCVRPVPARLVMRPNDVKMYWLVGEFAQRRKRNTKTLAGLCVSDE